VIRAENTKKSTTSNVDSLVSNARRLTGTLARHVVRRPNIACYDRLSRVAPCLDTEQKVKGERSAHLYDDVYSPMKTHSHKKQNGQKTDRLTRTTVVKRQPD